MAQDKRVDLLALLKDELGKSLGKSNILGYNPDLYPKQTEVFKCQAQGRYVAGGNRAGKSDTLVLDMIWTATNTHPFRPRPEHWGDGPVELRCVVVDIVKGVEGIILPKLKRWVARSMLKDGDWMKSWDQRTLTFTFENGSTIEFLTHGMDLDKHGGQPKHALYFDEVPPQDIFIENLMRLVDYRGFWLIAATSTQGIGWEYEELVEPGLTDPDWPIKSFTLSQLDNPFLDTPKNERDFYFIGASKEDRKIREEGEFTARQGFIFPNMREHPEKYVLDHHIAAPKSWQWYSSVDFGFSNQTAWLWHAVSPNGAIYTFAEHCASGLNVNQHSEIVHEMERAWGMEPYVRVGDPAGKQNYGTTGTSYVSEYAKNGIYINVETITNNVPIGVDKMHQYLQILPVSPWGTDMPTWRISPHCPTLIKQMQMLRWDTAESQKVAYRTNPREGIYKKNDHAPDSARYFLTLMPDLKPVREIDPLPTPDNPRTVSFVEMMSRISANPNEHLVTDSSVTQWREVDDFPELRMLG